MTAALIAQLVAQARHWPGQEITRLADWQAHASTIQGETPFSAMILRAVGADRVAWAFFEGYQAALRHLVPGLPAGGVAAICISEQEGNHPRHIHTQLSQTAAGRVLQGEKTYVLGGEAADHLLILANTGKTQEGRPVLVMIQLPGNAPGMEHQPANHVTLIPEIPHGKLHLQAVPVLPEQCLPGDGYDLYAKPFRQIEDIYVQTALCAMLYGWAERFDWESAVKERLLLQVQQGHWLASQPVDEAAVHLLLSGWQSEFAGLLVDLEALWKFLPEDWQQRWLRDSKLAMVGKAAGQKRTRNAWASLSGSPAP